MAKERGISVKPRLEWVKREQKLAFNNSITCRSKLPLRTWPKPNFSTLDRCPSYLARQLTTQIAESLFSSVNVTSSASQALKGFKQSFSKLGRHIVTATSCAKGTTKN